MIAVIQRVKNAKVTVNKDVAGEINAGFLVYLGIMDADDENDLEKIVEKLITMRIIADEDSKMNKSIVETKGEILLIPQFTLCADTQGLRPSFSKAKNPKEAKVMFENCVKMLISKGIKTEKGVFGAYMQVTSVNDGPITFIINSDKI